MPFKAFADDISQKMIEDFTLENQGDRLSIYGSLQITCDQVGLNYARELLTILQDAVKYLEQQDLPEQLPPPADSKEVDNPFWQP